MRGPKRAHVPRGDGNRDLHRTDRTIRARSRTTIQARNRSNTATGTVSNAATGTVSNTATGNVSENGNGNRVDTAREQTLKRVVVRSRHRHRTGNRLRTAIVTSVIPARIGLNDDCWRHLHARGLLTRNPFQAEGHGRLDAPPSGYPEGLIVVAPLIGMLTVPVSSPAAVKLRRPGTPGQRARASGPVLATEPLGFSRPTPPFSVRACTTTTLTPGQSRARPCRFDCIGSLHRLFAGFDGWRCTTVRWFPAFRIPASWFRNGNHRSPWASSTLRSRARLLVTGRRRAMAHCRQRHVQLDVPAARSKRVRTSRALPI